MNGEKKEVSAYEAYKRYYPDKWEAISVLRRDTGMAFTEANQVINALFGMTDDDERKKDDAEQELIYQAQLAQEAEEAAKKGKGLLGMIRRLFGSDKEA